MLNFTQWIYIYFFEEDVKFSKLLAYVVIQFIDWISFDLINFFLQIFVIFCEFHVLLSYPFGLHIKVQSIILPVANIIIKYPIQFYGAIMIAIFIVINKRINWISIMYIFLFVVILLPFIIRREKIMFQWGNIYLFNQNLYKNNL